MPCASAATGFVVHAKIDNDLALLYVPKDCAGVALREKIAIDGTVLGDVILDSVPLGETVVLTRGQAAEDLKRKIDIILNFGIAAELLGTMHAAADEPSTISACACSSAARSVRSRRCSIAR